MVPKESGKILQIYDTKPNQCQNYVIEIETKTLKFAGGGS